MPRRFARTNRFERRILVRPTRQGAAVSRMKPHALAGLTAVLLVTVLAAAGCGGGGKKSAATTTATTATSGTSTVAMNSTIAAQVPAKIHAKGTLTVAADATYAPNEFIGPDGHTIMGMSPDLGHAIGSVLGL